MNDEQLVWKSFIDFEIKQGETERVRQLYVRLLQRTKHVKVCVCALRSFSLTFGIAIRFGFRARNSKPAFATSTPRDACSRRPMRTSSLSRPRKRCDKSIV